MKIELRRLVGERMPSESMTIALATTCGHYEYPSVQVNEGAHAVPDDFATKRSWLKPLADIECGVGA